MTTSTTQTLTLVEAEPKDWTMELSAVPPKEDTTQEDVDVDDFLVIDNMSMLEATGPLLQLNSGSHDDDASSDAGDLLARHERTDGIRQGSNFGICTLAVAAGAEVEESEALYRTGCSESPWVEYTAKRGSAHLNLRDTRILSRDTWEEILEASSITATAPFTPKSLEPAGSDNITQDSPQIHGGDEMSASFIWCEDETDAGCCMLCRSLGALSQTSTGH